MHYKLSLKKTAGGQPRYDFLIDDQVVFESTQFRNSLVAKDIAAEYLAARGLNVEAKDIFINVVN